MPDWHIAGMRAQNPEEQMLTIQSGQSRPRLDHNSVTGDLIGTVCPPGLELLLGGAKLPPSEDQHCHTSLSSQPSPYYKGGPRAPGSCLNIHYVCPGHGEEWQVGRDLGLLLSSSHDRRSACNAVHSVSVLTGRHSGESTAYSVQFTLPLSKASTAKGRHMVQNRKEMEDG